MLKSCRYCGKIHDSKFDCGKKPKFKKKYDDSNSFRNNISWKKKRRQIRIRDLYMCQICKRMMYGTINQYNSEGLEVHHCDKASDYPERIYDDDNLITLCERHHEMAEDGRIPREVIKKIILEQEGAPQGANPGK